MRFWVRDHKAFIWFMIVSISLISSFAMRERYGMAYHINSFLFLYSVIMMIKSVWGSRESGTNEIGRLMQLQGTDPLIDGCIAYCRNKKRFPSGLVKYALKKAM